MGADLSTTKTYKFLTEKLGTSSSEKEAIFSDLRAVTETPWLVVLQAVHTDNTIEAMVHGALMLGRGITTDKFHQIDLTTVEGHRFGVSRQHAVLHVKNNHLMVRDLDSSNGTYLNGYRLAARVDAPVRAGDMLELGKLRFRVVIASRSAGI